MKYNTQNDRIAVITEKTLVVGIDVGSETHYARAFDNRSFEYSKKPLEFKNDKSGFKLLHAWMADMMEKHGKTEVLPGMEPTGHYWLNLGAYLQGHGMRPVLVNPHHVKKSKELDDNNPSKNDRKDPKTIAVLVTEGRYSYPYIPTGVYAEIRSLSNLRIQCQEEITRIKNRIARWISIYFPEYKGVYRDTLAVSGLMILKEAPLPGDIRELGADGVNQIWRNAKLKAAGMKRAMTLTDAAEHSIGSKEAPECARLEIRQLITDYETYQNRMDDLVTRIDEKMHEIPYIDRILEIKGIGMKTASCFVAEVGDLRRFDNSRQLQKLAGLAIVKNESGKHKGQSHISYRGRKRLRYALYEAAVSVIAKNEEFRELYEYYRTRQDNPLKKMQAVIAISCKLIRVFYALLIKGTAYDGEKMMGDIRRPQSGQAVA